MARDYIPELADKLTHSASKRACATLTQLLEKEGFAVAQSFQHQYAEKTNSKRVCKNNFVHLRASRENKVVVARFDSADVTKQMTTANAWGHLPRTVIYLRTAYGALEMGLSLEKDQKRETMGLLFTYDLPSNELESLAGLILNAQLFFNDHAVRYTKGALTVAQKPFYQDESILDLFRTSGALAQAKPALSVPTRPGSTQGLSSRPTDRTEAY